MKGINHRWKMKALELKQVVSYSTGMEKLAMVIQLSYLQLRNLSSPHKTAKSERRVGCVEISSPFIPARQCHK